jgi:protein-S-isoprenylcysteine O-methyltransferase Ste14
MSIKAWAGRHPRLVMWAVLALGMVVILVWAAKDVGLLSGQWAALIAATVLLAGLCVWIITWEVDEEEETQETADRQSPGA